MTNVYAVLDELAAEDDHKITLACDTLDIGRSGYYAHCQHDVTTRQQRDDQLRPIIRQIFWQHRRRYGARRIQAELAARGERCGLARVGRLLRELDLRALQPKSYHPRTTDSRHRLGYSPNLLLEAPSPTIVNHVWVGDITYLPLATGNFAYLALLLDLYSRRLVGWCLEEHMAEPLVLAALKQAITHRQPPAGLIHHTDRGGQYAGAEYRRLLSRADMRQSMSRAANCYDNSVIESCFGTLKHELQVKRYDNIMSARRQVGAYIAYYNIQRRHSALGYYSPNEFEHLATSRCQSQAPADPSPYDKL